MRSTKTSFQPGLVQILGWYIACYLDEDQTATLRGKLEVYTVILTNIIWCWIVRDFDPKKSRVKFPPVANFM